MPAIIVLLTASGPVAGHTLHELEKQLAGREAYLEVVNRPAPALTLKDGAGTITALADLRSKVVVLWFVQAGCRDFCPLHTEAVARIQAKVNRTPMRELVRFVAITTDPERDSPDILRAYGPAHGLETENFTFLTSGADRPGDTRALAAAFGLKFTPTNDGQQMHGVVTHVIDKSGNVRARVHGLKFDPVNVLLYVNALTNDYH
ncbi:MAG: SCO family protein [Rhodospirillales bacterium]